MTPFNLKDLEPRIIIQPEIKLAVKSITMSFAEDKTSKLWQEFGPLIKDIPNKTDNDKYSVQIYPDVSFFEDFNPTREFRKYAGVQVIHYENWVESFDKLVIPAGQYAAFDYVGKPSEAAETFRYILTQWLPSASVMLDNRPHIAIMGDRYKGEHPASEEVLLIPIKLKHIGN